MLFVTAYPKSFSVRNEDMLKMWKQDFADGETDIMYKPFTLDVLYQKIEGLIGPRTSGIMNSPPLPRIEIYRQVRVVLVRHLIDIGRLSIQISTSHLHLHGSLCRLPGVTAALTPEIVQSIFSELGRIHGIRRVDGDFDNWRQVDEAGPLVGAGRDQEDRRAGLEHFLSRSV